MRFVRLDETIPRANPPLIGMVPSIHPHGSVFRGYALPGFEVFALVVWREAARPTENQTTAGASIRKRHLGPTVLTNSHIGIYLSLLYIFFPLRLRVQIICTCRKRVREPEHDLPEPVHAVVAVGIVRGEDQAVLADPVDDYPVSVRHMLPPLSGEGINLRPIRGMNQNALIRSAALTFPASCTKASIFCRSIVTPYFSASRSSSPLARAR